MPSAALKHPTSDTPAQRRKKQVRQALQSSGLRLVAQHGLDKVSVEQILGAAGYSRRTFYGYYANKLELLADAMNPAFEDGALFLQKISPQEPKQIIAGIVDCYLELWQQHRDALIAIASLDDPAIGPYIEPGHRKFGNALREVLSQAADAKVLRNDDANYSFKIISRTAVPLLKICTEYADGAELYRESMQALLLNSDASN